MEDDADVPKITDDDPQREITVRMPASMHQRSVRRRMWIKSR